MREVYSHSRLACFEQCPKKFYYRYVQKIPAESESVEAFMGKRVHEVLERLYQVAARGLVPSLGRVLHRFNAFWHEHFDAARVHVVRAEDTADVYRQRGERCLSNYYRRHYPFDADQTLATEARVSFSLDSGNGYRMRGVIDRLVRARDGALEIHDYKTGRFVPSQARLDADRQLALYQLAVVARHGDESPIRLVWHYLQRNQTRTSERSREQLEELRAQTIGLIDRIRRETRFEPRSGPLCRWCEYADRCPASPTRATASASAALAPADADGQLFLL